MKVYIVLQTISDQLGLRSLHSCGVFRTRAGAMRGILRYLENHWSGAELNDEGEAKVSENKGRREEVSLTLHFDVDEVDLQE